MIQNLNKILVKTLMLGLLYVSCQSQKLGMEGHKAPADDLDDKIDAIDDLKVDEFLSRFHSLSPEAVDYINRTAGHAHDSADTDTVSSSRAVFRAAVDHMIAGHAHAPADLRVADVIDKLRSLAVHDTEIANLIKGIRVIADIHASVDAPPTARDDFAGRVTTKVEQMMDLHMRRYNAAIDHIIAGHDPADPAVAAVRARFRADIGAAISHITAGHPHDPVDPSVARFVAIIRPDPSAMIMAIGATITASGSADNDFCFGVIEKLVANYIRDTTGDPAAAAVHAAANAVLTQRMDRAVHNPLINAIAQINPELKETRLKIKEAHLKQRAEAQRTGIENLIRQNTAERQITGHCPICLEDGQESEQKYGALRQISCCKQHYHINCLAEHLIKSYSGVDYDTGRSHDIVCALCKKDCSYLTACLGPRENIR